MVSQQSLIVELEDAINSGSVERRVETLRRITDLFLTGASMYSEQQVTLFDDVMGRLTTLIETKARAELSDRLASIPNAPVNVVRALANDDEIEVAAPVLTYSERLDDRDLIKSAQTKSQQHLLAISNRVTLSEAVTDVLVERGDKVVVHSVVKNQGAQFSDNGFDILVKRSDYDEVLAELVGLRDDIPSHQFVMLVSKASDAVQAKLIAGNPRASGEIRNVVTDIAGKIKTEVSGPAYDYTAAKHLIENLQASGRLAESAINEFAKDKKFEETIAGLALMCGLPTEVVERAVLDERPDMVLILAKAAGYCWATTKLILMLRTSYGGPSKQELERALSSFDRLQVATAQRAVRFYQARQNQMDVEAPRVA
ncbi:MAG TPA: DUF2336 domain-containing protein [Xanthobacteraceae bacterium]|jgi:uncharacterized protein (DUF2336 family)|nr:DUF2336 domain-containing protein [Xanthobacteraceae bacterium]